MRCGPWKQLSITLGKGRGECARRRQVQYFADTGDYISGPFADGVPMDVTLYTLENQASGSASQHVVVAAGKVERMYGFSCAGVGQERCVRHAVSGPGWAL